MASFGDNPEGTEQKVVYIGIIPLILAVMALFSKKKSDEQKAFIFLLIFSVLLAMGKYSPFFFLYFLPPFNLFRAPARFFLLTAFCLSLLASYGLDSIFKKAGVELDEGGHEEARLMAELINKLLNENLDEIEKIKRKQEEEY